MIRPEGPQVKDAPDSARARSRLLRALLAHRAFSLALGVFSVLSITNGIWRWSADRYGTSSSATWTTSGVVIVDGSIHREFSYRSAAGQARSGLLPSERKATAMDNQHSVAKRTTILLVIGAFLCLLSLGTGRIDRVASPVFAMLAGAVVLFAIWDFGRAAQDTIATLRIYENSDSNGRTPAALAATLCALAIPARLLVPKISSRLRAGLSRARMARQARFDAAVRRAVLAAEESRGREESSAQTQQPAEVRTAVAEPTPIPKVDAPTLAQTPSPEVSAPASHARGKRTTHRAKWLVVGGLVTIGMIVVGIVKLLPQPKATIAVSKMTERQLRSALLDGDAKNALDVVRILGMPFTAGRGGGGAAYYVYVVANDYQAQVWFYIDSKAPVSVEFKSRAELTLPEQMKYLLYDSDD